MFKSLAIVAATTLALAGTGTGVMTRAHVGKPGCDPKPDPPANRRAVDLVICLDTSGSMSGLIDSAKSRLWDIVGELGQMQPTPHLRVGLLTYGSPHVSSPQQGWVVKQSDLTDDLDTFYSKLMSLSTNGGEEYVGWVLNDALTQMSWSHDPDALRLIYVAGNESADQASNRFNFREVAAEARGCDITINSIYCGNREQGRREAWDQVATHGRGSYIAIDMSAGTQQIATPYDKALIELEVELNATYVPYGPKGQAGRKRMYEQDEAAEGIGVQAKASRAAAKATAAYNNAKWDLVDAAQEPDFDVARVPAEQLPAPMQEMTREEQRVYVEKVTKKREIVKQKIQEVNRQRAQHIEKEKKDRGGQASFDDAVRESARKAAEKKGFETKKP